MNIIDHQTKPFSPLQAIVIFPEIRSRSSLLIANAQTKALTDRIIKMSY